MNRTVVLVVVLISVLLAAWVALSIVGQETRPLDQAPPSDSMPAPNAPLPNAPAPQNSLGQKLTRSDQGEGNVNVSATYITENVLKEDPSLEKPQYQPEDEVVFLVTMNTHSVDLNVYKLEKLSVLKDAAGTENKPTGWQESGTSGGHHRSGYLKFKRAGDDGKDITGGSGSITLIVKDVAQVPERRFGWDLPIEPGGE